jgi:hypothetical protein
MPERVLNALQSRDDPGYASRLYAPDRKERLLHKTIAAVSLVAVVSCGGGSTPTTPATPPPTPTTTLAPAPTPDPALASCNPLPKKEWMAGFAIKVQPGLGTRNRVVLNASPLVANADYCVSVGLVPGGSAHNTCETREETDPQRAACDRYLAGTAKDTGRKGPTWYWNGALCAGGDASQSGCSNTADNQFLAYAYGTQGRWEACGGTGSNESCGVCLLDGGTGRCRRD